MPRVLLLLPSSTYRAPDFLEAAGRLGIQVTVGTDRRQAVAEADAGGAVGLDFRPPERAVAQIVRLAGRFPFAAIVPTDEETALLAAMASEALGLPANPPDAARAAGDKHTTRVRLARAGLPGPWFRRFRAGDDPAELARALEYPCVLKPTFLSGSRGVLRADDPASFCAAFLRVADLLRQPEVAERGGGRAEEILVEEYLPGSEHALEGILAGGRLHTLALFDKPDPLEGPCFPETLYVTPSRMAPSRQVALTAAVQAALSALGLREGAVHAEMRHSPGGPVVLEAAARSIGGRCSRALRFGTGMSLEEVILRHALGEADPPPREEAAAGVLMLPVSRAGILGQVRGIEEARRVPGIVQIEITIPRGARLVPLPEGDRYLGFVFARGVSPHAVESALRDAWARLSVRLEAEAPAPPADDHRRSSAGPSSGSAPGSRCR